MDDVDLTFEEDALVEIARKSIERKTGARGLRAIMENVMMDYMYTVPSDDSITRLRVTKEMVDSNLILMEHEKKEEPLSIQDKTLPGKSA
jgi:ATP-dependent Clp protease ATP-binding subunit ClpX